MGAASEIDRIVTENGVIVRRAHPELSGSIDWLVRTKALRSVLPGIYAARERADDFETRVAAATASDSDAVIVGSAAARLTFWPKLTANEMTVASPTHRPRGGPISVQRRTIPPELVLERNGLRLSTPALTALDLAVSTSGGSIDTVLRRRRACLPDLHEALALTPRRQGNADRRQLLLDSRDEPWSFAERAAHRELRSAGITGWLANYRIPVRGAVYYVDIAFTRPRLAVEIAGREFHGPETFDQDRWRQNDIILDGWHVLRFSADAVTRQGALFVCHVAQALEQWG